MDSDLERAQTSEHFYNEFIQVGLHHIYWAIIENQRLKSVTSLLFDFQHPLATKPNLISKYIALQKKNWHGQYLSYATLATYVA